MFVPKWKLYISHTVIVTFFQSASLSLFNRPYLPCIRIFTNANLVKTLLFKYRQNTGKNSTCRTGEWKYHLYCWKVNSISNAGSS